MRLELVVDTAKGVKDSYTHGFDPSFDMMVFDKVRLYAIIELSGVISIATVISQPNRKIVVVRTVLQDFFPAAVSLEKA